PPPPEPPPTRAPEPTVEGEEARRHRPGTPRTCPSPPSRRRFGRREGLLGSHGGRIGSRGIAERPPPSDPERWKRRRRRWAPRRIARQAPPAPRSTRAPCEGATFGRQR